MPPTVTTAPADAAFAACGPLRPPLPVPALPAPITSAALVQVDQLRRALDLELRLADALPAAVQGAAGRALREATQALLQGVERRATALREALVAAGSAPLRRPCACAEALAAELTGALWDGDGAAADAVLALALHRVAQLAAATHRGVRTLCRAAGMLAVARNAAHAAREHETSAQRFLELAVQGQHGGATHKPWRTATLTHSAA
jgi:ferritin-like metal-binding protein YciE